MKYSEKLKDPRWQKKRLTILNRDSFCCTVCGDDKNTLHVHHIGYHGDPWDVPDNLLTTLCESCHETEHEARPQAEKMILQAFREKRLMSFDIEVLANGIASMEVVHTENVTVSAIAWAMSNSEVMHELTNSFLNRNKKPPVDGQTN